MRSLHSASAIVLGGGLIVGIGFCGLTFSNALMAWRDSLYVTGVCNFETRQYSKAFSTLRRLRLNESSLDALQHAGGRYPGAQRFPARRPRMLSARTSIIGATAPPAQRAAALRSAEVVCVVPRAGGSARARAMSVTG